MDSRVHRFFDKIKDKQIAVLGIGVSHTDLILQFAQKGIRVTACDKRSREQLGEICGRFESLGVTLRLGENYLDGLEADIVLRTPGMPFTLPVLTAFRKKGVVVTSEMELFFDLCPCKTYAVTGSDGKTTTTTLISEMLRSEGKTVHLGGNIGKALFPLIEEISPDDCAVVELSSFQLLSMRCSPDVSVVTNVAPNHLDIHEDMDEYILAKRNIFEHQNAFSRTVLNADNRITAGFSGDIRGEAVLFSRQSPVGFGAYLDETGMLCMADRDGVKPIMRQENIRIPGVHNVENYLAAISAVWGEVSPETMARVAKTFGGVEHRIEFVAEIDGVKYYNDSIATSPTRTIAGLNAFSQKLIIIAGGYDKKIPYEPLAPKILEKVKILVLTGATALKIEAAVKACAGYGGAELEIIHADSMEHAVQFAKNCAQPGDVVSLSPASASFDCYPNFEARGRHFKQIVFEMQK